MSEKLTSPPNPDNDAERKASVARMLLENLIKRVKGDAGFQDLSKDEKSITTYKQNEFEDWFMGYLSILSLVGGSFTAEVAATIFLDLLKSTDLKTLDRKIVSTEVKIELPAESIIEKNYPEIEVVATLFQRKIAEAKMRQNVVALVKMVVEYRYPFAQEYYQLIVRESQQKKKPQ
jgi:hypothetical protein